MDTSELYIKMCGKATEIQDIKQDKKNRWALTDFIRKVHGMFTWLPRQDQLQEMLNGLDGIYVSITSPQGNTNYKYGFTEILLRRCLLNKFHQWCNNNEYHVMFRFHTPFDSFESMEQLWLAFVMGEKYNKTWDGKDWVME